MGFELNRIMKQYGVSTPGMASYTGTAAPSMPTAPTGERPAGEDDAAKANQAMYDKQLADANAYKADPTAFNEQLRKYGLDQKSYDAYKTNYQNRLQNTPMYADLQFQRDQPNMDWQKGQSVPSTGFIPAPYPTLDLFTDTKKLADNSVKPTQQPGAKTVADLYKMYLGRDPEAGIVGTAAASTRPNFIQEAQRELSTKPTFGNQNLMDATGSYYGNQIKNPTYGAMPVSMINYTPQDKSDYYLQQRNLGYTDADLRNATTASFGKPTEDSWAQLTSRAYPQYNQNIVDAYKSIGRSWEGGPKGQIDTPGYNYWMNQLSSGTFKPENLNSTFAQAAAEEAARATVKKAHGGSVYNLTAKYALGGPVTPAPSQYKTSADMYRDILGREPESLEVQDKWNATFGDSIDADEVAHFKNAAAPELIGRTPAHISGLYKEVLGRAPDLGGAAYWADKFGDEVNADEMASFIQASQPEIAARAPKSVFGGGKGDGGGSTGGGSTNKDKLEKAAINAAASYFLGPTYDFASGARNIAQGNIGEAAGNFVSGVTGGISKAFGWADGGSVHDLAAKYAHGGPVKTHYQTAGAVKARHDYMSPEEEEAFNQRFRAFSATQPEAETIPVDMAARPAPVTTEPLAAIPAPAKSVLTEIAVKNAKDASEPVNVAPVPVVPKAAVPFGDERLGNIQALLAAYGPKDSAYAADLKTARESAKAETDAFAKMLKTAMSSPEDAQSSKAEMYFRLASAFGAPTKTGQFSENLSMVGKELGEYAKNKRASAKEKLALALEAQKMKMTSAKEDLNTLRALTGEEMKDKRAIATELLKNYIKSGEPQSAAGKQALDEGLVPGTPAYQARVEVIGNMNIEAKMAQINSALSGVSTAAANLSVTQSKLDLDRQRFDQQKAQQAKLSPGEVRLKVDTEDTLAQTDQAMTNLKKAYSLNPNTFDGSLLDVAQRKLYESSGSKDPKVVATRELENLLKKASLSQLKATFPGAISNDERAALDAVQGLDAKSKDERAVIMKNAFTALKSVSERHRRRLLEINQGVYRDTAAPIEEGDK
jgi:hypothetical protein